MAAAAGWCFTRNRREDETQEDFLGTKWTQLPERATWLFFQHEKEARDHFQGAVWFKNKVRLATVVRALGGGGIHVERARGTPQQQVEYCSKQETKVAGPWELGVRPRQGRRTDIEETLKAVKKRGYQEAFTDPKYAKTMVKYPRGMQDYEWAVKKKARIDKGYVKPRIWVLWGPTDTGKTRWATTSSDSWWIHPDLDEKWWDGYNGEDRIILDEFACQWKLQTLLSTIDGTINQKATKGSHVILQNVEWVFTANSDPSTWYPNCRQEQRDALFNRLFHRFESMVWFTGTNVQCRCPCTKCSPVGFLS